MNTVKNRMTLEEFFALDDGAEQHYEFVNGEVLEMPPESWLNVRIARFLVAALGKLIPLGQIAHKDTEIELAGRVRLPDVMILAPVHLELLEGATRATITHEMPPPLLIVEVVSPGKVNRDYPEGGTASQRDYRYKRSEYAARGIAEYWIVDPVDQQVVLLVLVDGLYEETIYRGADRIQSIVFPELGLTVESVLKAEG